jgi:hypothetical protein
MHDVDSGGCQAWDLTVKATVNKNTSKKNPPADQYTYH